MWHPYCQLVFLIAFVHSVVIIQFYMTPPTVNGEGILRPGRRAVRCRCILKQFRYVFWCFAADYDRSGGSTACYCRLRLLPVTTAFVVFILSQTLGRKSP